MRGTEGTKGEVWISEQLKLKRIYHFLRILSLAAAPRKAWWVPPARWHAAATTISSLDDEETEVHTARMAATVPPGNVFNSNLHMIITSCQWEQSTQINRISKPPVQSSPTLLVDLFTPAKLHGNPIFLFSLGFNCPTREKPMGQGGRVSKAIKFSWEW